MTKEHDPTKPVTWWFEAHNSAYIFFPHEKERALQCARLRNVELKPLYDASLLSEYEKVKAERDEALSEEYQRSNKKVDELQAVYEAQIDERDQKIAALEAENKRLREALAFYADRKNWDDDGFSTEDGPNVITLVPSSIDNDQGKQARAALATEGDQLPQTHSVGDWPAQTTAPVGADPKEIEVLQEPVAWQAKGIDGIWRYVEMPRTAAGMGMEIRGLVPVDTPAPQPRVEAFHNKEIE